jgi:hypothetical protein
MFVHGQASQGAYSVQFAPLAEQGFRGTPPGVGAEIRKRLQEIALIAGLLPSEAADEANHGLRLEIGGYIITYVLRDAERTLTVLSVNRFSSQGSAANQ